MSFLLLALPVGPLPTSTPPGAAEEKVERGRALYAACAACHTAGGAAQLGPELRGVLNRRAASVPGFPYSRALRRSGLTWDEGTLDRFIADPQALVPGNTMPYAGEPDPAARAALLAYLKTLRPVSP